MNWYSATHNLIYNIITVWSSITIIIAVIMLFTKKHYWKYFWISNLIVFIISLLSLLIYDVVEITIPNGYVYPIILSIILYNWCFIICMIVNYIIYRISRHNITL